MNKLIAYFAKNGLLVNIITIFILAVGVFSSLKISREVFPNIGFDVVTIETVFPGGSAESAEKLITNPIEQDLSEVNGIKKMTSLSTEGRSLIVLQLDSGETTVDEAKEEVQDVIDAFVDLPFGAEKPSVTVQEFKNFPVIQVSLSGDITYEQLEKNAKFIRRQVRKIPQISRVNYLGLKQAGKKKI